MIRQAFDRLWSDKRGNIIVIAGAALPLFVGAAGLATDTIQWTLWKRQLQRAADSAAIAGVYNRESEANASTFAAAAVAHDLTINRHMKVGMSAVPTVTFPANSGVMTNQVNVVLTVQQRLPFSAMFLATPPTITATARAASIPAGGDACIEALDTGAVTGVTFTGDAEIHAPDCVIFSNSRGANSAIARGSAKVTAEAVGGVGGIRSSNNFLVGSYRPYSPPLPDPFINVNPDPADMNCAPGALTEDTVLVPGGVNCFTALAVGSNQTLNVPANFGPIYISGGPATVRGTFNCVGCTLVLTNKNSASPIGSLTGNGNNRSDINITAPTSGPYRGIAIYKDRRANDCSNCNKLNGNNSSIITGAIYFPSQELEYNGNGTTAATCTMFVAKRINFSGNSTVSNKFNKLTDCAHVGLPSNAATRIVRLVG